MLRFRALCLLLCLVCPLAATAQTDASQTATLTLAWDASVEPDITGYKVLYGTASGAYDQTVDVGLVTTYTVTALSYSTKYFFAVQAYDSAGTLSAPSAEVSDTTAAAPVVIVPGSIILGLGPQEANGGWFGTLAGTVPSFTGVTWGRLPWSEYNEAGGGIRVAAGDVDGDAGDELIVGLGPGGGGWVAVLDDAAHNRALLKWIRVGWSQYETANGEVFPAVGDIDGDGRSEIVLGLGQGGNGWFKVFDDATTDYKAVAWRQVNFSTYNAANGATHPTIADLDGDGAAEIVVGFGQGGNGWLDIFNGTAQQYSHRDWLRVAWDTYNIANGTTFPAAGDLDGDGRAEIVVGLGQGGNGWFQVFDDATTGFANPRWERVWWPAYNAANGELHPAVGNVDGDAAMEIVFGFGTFAGAGGAVAVRDDAARDFKHLTWSNAGWTNFTISGGSIFPTISK